MTEAETADTRKGCSGYAGLQARQNVKRVGGFKAPFTGAALPPGWLGPAFGGGAAGPLGQAAMESLRVPDLGPPVPIAGQVMGLDVDLRYYLVCLFVYQPLRCQVVEARWLEKRGFVLV